MNVISMDTCPAQNVPFPIAVSKVGQVLYETCCKSFAQYLKLS